MMDDDSFAEIKQIFIEEADEGLDIMETGLLELAEGASETELINDIFRAAHSIKGGSATFGFSNVSEFTHLLETLLDEMRDGTRAVSEAEVQVLLESVDCLREMIEAVKEDRDAESERSELVAKKLQGILDGDSTPSPSTKEAQLGGVEPSEPSPIANAYWKIRFTPNREILSQGNDPARLFRELGELGQLSVCALIDSLPTLQDMDPEHCYIAWDLKLVADCKKQQIEEVFDWVVAESILDIEHCCEAQQHARTNELHNDVVQSDLNETAKNLETSKEIVAKPDEDTPTRKKPDSSRPPKKADKGSIRVGIDKIDSLLNLVGELVITQSMLNRHSSKNEPVDVEKQAEDLRDGLAQLESNARELQDVAMKMRMLPIKTTFARFPRLVHDLTLQLGKKVNLHIIGENTELDKTVLEKIGDPLLHLVRNGLDHGLETPERRKAAGKSPTGTLTLSARHEAGNIIIEVVDDGAGINPEVIMAKAIERGLVKQDETLAPEEIPYLIFHPGFSTAQTLSDVSGRGVGMDVVKRNIQELGGRVEVKSEFGKGSKFTIRLPLTLAIIDGQLVRVKESTYVIPLLSIVETVVVDKARLNVMAAQSKVYRLRDEYIPVISMASAMQLASNYAEADEDIEGKLLVVVELANKLVGLVVDDLMDQQQVVLKSLEANYQQINGLTGATVLGDGAVALIIDIPGLIDSFFGSSNAVAGEQAAA